MPFKMYVRRDKLLLISNLKDIRIYLRVEVGIKVLHKSHKNWFEMDLCESSASLSGGEWQREVRGVALCAGILARIAALDMS